MSNNISFRAHFDIAPSGYEERVRYTNEGLGKDTISRLSEKLDARTPKNYKLVLTYRDRNREEDSYVLRKKTSQGWQNVADYTTQPMSKRALSVERLVGIFNILRLKEKHQKEIVEMDRHYEEMKIRQREEMSDAVRMFDVHA